MGWVPSIELVKIHGFLSHRCSIVKTGILTGNLNFTHLHNMTLARDTYCAYQNAFRYEYCTFNIGSRHVFGDHLVRVIA